MVETVHEAFLVEGVRLAVTKECVARVGGPGSHEGNGGARVAFHAQRIMLHIMYEVPSREDIAEVTINRAVVEGKKASLIRKKQDKTRPNGLRPKLRT